ncbi:MULTISPECIES: ABC transporter ATP-binding protein [Pseudanabaena]|uniref:Teichoic-acid-transporting ATPase n=2 Tax=Pseudanabaena TaxID=1152 RepID=L8MXW2_9CYAN|nr:MULTISPECIES: ABC transporter ATP-binding protein [Pseudanabaena]ELS30813.1 Teichoic-acid-transporting ATPase [Pseudanabaena biceps PCC 7429]MDG3496924.1 ABC transporter ATP-binding protein [Pseudanabaena catenata USMAC16]
MSDVVIQVENLSKKYIIGHQKQESYRSLREAIANGTKKFAQNFLRKDRFRPDEVKEEFWALKDISFEIKRGDRIGIIGRNGAGKSTLLKILSRIIEPTAGKILIKGRVVSLLEVGTGFHPELTGRENIYLNGAILGMKRNEIKTKFDEIVAFAEVERFLDTPVKRYSSGMYIRLAFAVAAHLEPEILIVDEVLAVGDAAFQKKCLGKMEDVGKQGRTVLFVSHNIAAVEKLCDRGILLANGELRYIGDRTNAITKYLSSLTNNVVSLRDRQDRQGTGEIKVVSIDIRDEDGKSLDVVKSGQNISIYLYFETKLLKNDRILAGISFKTNQDNPVFLHHSRLTQNTLDIAYGRGAFVCQIKRLPLPSSVYRLSYSIMPNNGRDGSYFDSMDSAIDVTVVDGDFYDSGEVPPISHGVSLVNALWHSENYGLANI